MKKINDKNLIKNAVEKISLAKKFDISAYQLHIHEYDKGEFLITPYSVFPDILFLTEGEVKIYSLCEDGSIGTICVESVGGVLGDCEFCTENRSAMFAEAITKVSCLVLPWKTYRNKLRKDPDFLMFLLHVEIGKMSSEARIASGGSALGDRLKFYISHMCPDQKITNINNTLTILHCSRRQLQRLLKNFCEKRVIEKTGRGEYRLVKE